MNPNIMIHYFDTFWNLHTTVWKTRVGNVVSLTFFLGTLAQIYHSHVFWLDQSIVCINKKVHPWRWNNPSRGWRRDNPGIEHHDWRIWIYRIKILYENQCSAQFGKTSSHLALSNSIPKGVRWFPPLEKIVHDLSEGT